MLRRAELPHLLTMARRAMTTPIGGDAVHGVMRRVLANCVPGTLDFMGFSDQVPAMAGVADNLAGHVRRHWPAWAAAYPAAVAAHEQQDAATSGARPA